MDYDDDDYDTTLPSTGWLPDVWDGEDHEYKLPGGVRDHEPVNLREKYPEYWDYPYNQYTLESCVANASAAAYAYESKKFFAEQKVEYLDDPSRMFIYWNARAAGLPYLSKKELQKDILTWEDVGTFNRTALKGLHKFGACAEGHWPYRPLQWEYREADGLRNTKNPGDMPDKDWDKKRRVEWKSFCARMSKACNEKPRQSAFKYAHYNRIAAYERLDVQRRPEEITRLRKTDPDGQRGLDGERVVKNLRVALSDGHPVVLGFTYYAEWPFVVDADTKRFRLMKLPGRHVKPKKFIRNHTVLAIGYDDDNVLCQNSWGANWGPDDGVRDGLFLMPWSYISDFEATSDFWIIKGFRPGSDIDAEDMKDAAQASASEEQKAKEKARVAAVEAARKHAAGAK